MEPSYSGTTPLISACFYGTTNVVKFLVENGADVTAGPSLVGYTPIIAAAQKHRGEIVKFLLRQGADPFVYTKVGRYTSLC